MVKKALILADDNTFAIPLIRRNIKQCCLLYLKAAFDIIRYRKIDKVRYVDVEESNKFYLTCQLEAESIMMGPIIIGEHQYARIVDWFRDTQKEVKAGEVAGLLRRWGRWKDNEDSREKIYVFDCDKYIKDK